MTKNQLAFWELEETKRNNARSWAETVRSNQARERETNRSNLAKEEQARRELFETNRSNIERERLNRNTLIESQRHSMATEAENMRSNLSQERLASENNLTNRLKVLGDQANTRSQISVNRQQVGVSERDLMNRVLMANETARANRANEAIKREQTAESIRSNQASESIRHQQVLNDLLNVNTTIKRDQLNFESAERNRQLEREKLIEQKRHNEVGEYIGAWNTTLGAASSVLKVGLLKGARR